MTHHVIPTETLRQVLDALQGVDDLIKHRYTGTKEGMNALQYAADDCLLAMAVLKPLVDAPSEPQVMSKAFCDPKQFDDEDLAYSHDYLNE